MRIISGKLKGRKLCSWKGRPPLRPMTDRVKESLFNVLRPYFFKDCLFLDLFSGTGSLALEALSRGAARAHAVEKRFDCAQIIKKNSLILPDPKKLILHKRDVFSFLKEKNPLSGEKPAFDIIAADPPFALKAGDKIMELLKNSPLCRKNTAAAVETGQSEKLKKRYENFYLFSEKDFNDKKVWFYEYR